MKKIATINANETNERVGVYYDDEEKTLCEQDGTTIECGKADDFNAACELVNVMYSGSVWDLEWEAGIID